MTQLLLTKLNFKRIVTTRLPFGVFLWIVNVETTFNPKTMWILYLAIQENVWINGSFKNSSYKTLYCYSYFCIHLFWLYSRCLRAWWNGAARGLDSWRCAWWGWDKPPHTCFGKSQQTNSAYSFNCLQRVGIIKVLHSRSMNLPPCSICLEQYVKGEKISILPCQHAFHYDCIVPWLGERNSCCPVCKNCPYHGKDVVRSVEI